MSNYIKILLTIIFSLYVINSSAQNPSKTGIDIKALNLVSNPDSVKIIYNHYADKETLTSGEEEVVFREALLSKAEIEKLFKYLHLQNSYGKPLPKNPLDWDGDSYIELFYYKGNSIVQSIYLSPTNTKCFNVKMNINSQACNRSISKEFTEYIEQLLYDKKIWEKGSGRSDSSDQELMHDYLLWKKYRDKGGL